MAAYNASTGIWSTCNSGGMPADGDEITVSASLLAMDENANVAHTFTVVVEGGNSFYIHGWDIAAVVSLGYESNFYGNGGTFSGTLAASADCNVDLGTGTALVGAVDMDGNSCTWSGTGDRKSVV